jgi:AcrR family transcriptional regulator
VRGFDEAGSRGATTRRIAAEAGVNEITLFRHFGSKGTLLSEALQQASRETVETGLPLEPRDSIAVIDGSAYEAPSTKQAAEALAASGPKGPTLILCDPEETGVLKSFRNIPKADVLPVGSAGVADVIGHASLIVTQTALETLEARVGDVDRMPKGEEGEE